MRLEALGRGPGQHLRACPGLDLDPAPNSVYTSSGETLLTPTEFRVLAAVMSRPDEVTRRRSVVAAAWPNGAVVAENTVDSVVRRLRT